MPTTRTMTPAERKEAARKLIQELDNDVEYQRSIAKRLEAFHANPPKEATNDDLATKVAGLEKAYQRVEKMLSLTNEGRMVQKAIELEAQLEKVKEQLANAQDTIRVLQAEIKDLGLQNQGRETSHGYDSDEEWDKILNEHTTPTMQKYLNQRDAKNKRVHEEQQLQAREQREEGPATTNPSGKLSTRPTGTLTATRRAARARSVARARAWRAQHRRATAAAATAAVAAGMTEEYETAS